MDRELEFFHRDRKIHPPAFTPAHKTNAVRSSRHPLLSLQNALSEVTGPMFGAYDLGPLDNDPILNDANNGEPASRAHIIEPESRRRTQIAERNARGQDTVYMFDIYLHGEQETVFFDV